MNTYEAFVILKPILDVDNSDNVLKVIEDAVENLNGKVVKKDKLGRKRLAYEINKFKDGFITTYLFKLEPSSVLSLKRTCQLNEDILRLTLVNRSNIDITDASVYGRERPQDRDRPDHRGGGDRDRGGDRGEQREFRRPMAPRSAD
ncbi:30S ribosomal protein S6 [Vampirovibrio sp.]|uniref:30S ribosomal protein S6 n=1 Tax=Vampirovibrio sp. TaxID=2717857 RepID=UPI0035937EFD